MKLTYGEQTIDLFGEDIFPDGPPEKVVISLSGGCDSSSLTYLIGTNFPNIQMYPFHSKDEDCTIDTERAIEVHKFLQDKFPTVNDLEAWADMVEDVFKFGIPDVSTFIARRAQISGLRAAIKSFMT